MTGSAIQTFLSVLESRRAEAVAAVPAMVSKLRELRCGFGGRDLVKVLRPKFLTVSEYETLDDVAGVVVSACKRVADAAVHDKDLATFLGVTDEERPLIAIEPMTLDPIPFARLDSFLVDGTPRFVELNAEAPAGAGYSDMALEGMTSHPVVAAALRELRPNPICLRDGLLRALLKAWRRAGRRTIPQVLITDYLDLPTVDEFHILRDFFEARGVPTVLADPRHLEFRNGRLIAEGRAIDLVYRRVLVNEYLDRKNEVSALGEAVAQGAVVMVNPFRSKVAHKKAIFGLLTGDYRGTSWMTTEERRIVDRVVPWTRRLRECRTDYRGESIDLLDFVAANRDRFAVKPNDEYGGKGVVLGWTMDDAEFRRVLEDAHRGDFVVQERVPTETEPFPRLDRQLETEAMVVDLDPYVYFGRVHGVLARLAAGNLCNVTSGGGQTPVVIVPDGPGQSL